MCCLQSVLRSVGQGVYCALALEWLHSESRQHLPPPLALQTGSSTEPPVGIHVPRAAQRAYRFTERLPQCWRCYEIDRRSLGRGRRRSGPSCTQRLHARSQVCCTYPRHYAGSKLHKLCQSIGTLQVKVPGEVDEISQVDGFYGHGTGCLARELMATLHVDGVPDDEDATLSVGSFGSRGHQSLLNFGSGV